MNYNLLRTSYPLALSVFDNWLRSKELREGWQRYMPIHELPLPMAYGVLVWFFRDQGILFQHNVAGDGSMEVAILTLRPKSGRFAPAVKVSGINAYLQHDAVYQRAFIRAFKLLEASVAGKQTDDTQPPETLLVDTA